MALNEATQDENQPSNDELAKTVRAAHIPSLLVTLAQLSGDMTYVGDEFLPTSISLPQRGLTSEALEAARNKCLEGLIAWRDNKRSAPLPSQDALRQLMRYMTGHTDSESLALATHELALTDDVGKPNWTKTEIDPEREFSVVIVGAGMSGLVAAYYLSQVGIPFVVFERAAEIGGTWLNNTYPGVRLDSSSFIYSYSFFQDSTWPEEFPTGDKIFAYLKNFAKKFDLEKHIRFRTKVKSASFNRDTCSWDLVVDDGGGRPESLTAQAIITAVGQLSEPLYPDIPGMEEFRGESWHTARWNDMDLSEKRVAIIGTGASAHGVIPEVAERAKHLTIFQRTPGWVVPDEGYKRSFGNQELWLFRKLPYYHRWYRFNQFWINMDGRRSYAVVDPKWRHPVSVSATNERYRRDLMEYLESTFADRPDILEKVTPSFPPLAKRGLRDNGSWARALKKANVDLVTKKIERVSEKGVETGDGSQYELDVIIYGTGFKASDMLSSIAVTGYDGRTLAEQWAGNPRAYLGITVPNFPNLFCIYGPNTNLNLQGSTTLFSELAVEYTMECLKMLLSTHTDAIDVKTDVFEDYNARVDATHAGLAIGVSKVNSWYKNASGRVTQNWPFTTLERWTTTREINPGDYILLNANNTSGRRSDSKNISPCTLQ